jgi:hypothetical protein
MGKVSERMNVRATAGNRCPQSRRGFTLKELLVTMAVCFVCFMLFLGILLPALGRARHGADQIRDAAQLHEIHKSMVTWSQQNADWYPMPSKIDQDDATVTVQGDPTLKDATGAVYSILLFNGLIRDTDCFYSPAECGRAVRRHEGYSLEAPPLANNPANARWDPSFRGTPFDDTPGLSAKEARFSHTSYAHLALAGLGRRSEWKNSQSSNYAALGNRGPEELSGNWDPATGRVTATTLADGVTGTKSITLLIHGERETWEGNIAYNDNHVDYEMSTHPEGMLYTVVKDEQQLVFGDGLFLDEADSAVLSGGAMEDTRDANCYLGLFRRGPTHEEYRYHEQAVKFIKQARWFDGMKK